MTNTPTLKPIEALKPCPFCGGEAIVNKNTVDNVTITCKKYCAKVGGSRSLENEGAMNDMCFVRWNTRAAPKVMQLEWNGVESDCYSSAQTPMGEYSAMVQYDDEWSAEFDAATDKLAPKSVSGICYSLNEAKAAAQSHYEQTILSELET